MGKYTIPVDLYKPLSSYLCLSELQILAASVDHGVAGDLEEGRPLVQVLQLRRYLGAKRNISTI